MARSADRSPEWIFFLAAVFIFGAVSPYTLIIYQFSPELVPAMRLLLVWLVLAIRLNKIRGAGERIWVEKTPAREVQLCFHRVKRSRY